MTRKSMFIVFTSSLMSFAAGCVLVFLIVSKIFTSEHLDTSVRTDIAIIKLMREIYELNNQGKIEEVNELTSNEIMFRRKGLSYILDEGASTDLLTEDTLREVRSVLSEKENN